MQRLVDQIEPLDGIGCRYAAEEFLRLRHRDVERRLDKQSFDAWKIAIGRGARHHSLIGDLLEAWTAALLHEASRGVQQVLAGSPALVDAAGSFDVHGVSPAAIAA